MAHDLKTWPEAFSLVWDGKKLFEIRINDRNFREGDTLVLREFDKNAGSVGLYSGRIIHAEVTCIVRGWGMPSNLVVMGIHVFDRTTYARDDESLTE